MKKSNKNTNRIYFLILIISYVAGIVLFAYLKMLGLRELSEFDEKAQHALLPISACMGLLIASGISFLEFKVLNRWKHYSFGKFVLLKYSIITALEIAVSIIVYMLFALWIEKKPLSIIIETIPEFLQTEIFISIFIYLILFSILLNMIITIAEYLGPKAVIGALLGKYNQPVEEDLTFIFIDLKSSTSIAERMGHVKYSRFIGNCYLLLAESIYQYNATIYQFVGDEAVLLWPTPTAQKTLAPINFYYDFQKRLKENSQLFLNEFGEVPHFKASIHTGVVTVTEIRTTQKDIVYHGDVLNTCARIIEQCSKLNKNLLVSEPVAAWIGHTNEYATKLIDSLSLRGQLKQTIIYEVMPVGSIEQTGSVSI